MHEVWFLTGSQGLYGPDTLAQVAAQSGEIAAARDAAGVGARGVHRRPTPPRTVSA